jgi:hypothetical protein
MSETAEYDLTGNYGLKKPWLDADDDVWGEHINENMDLIDNLLVTRGFDASKYLPLTGGEISGDLSVLGELSADGPVQTTGTGPALIGASTGEGIVLNDSTSNRLAGALSIDSLSVGALLSVTDTGAHVGVPQFVVDAPELIEINGPVGSVFLGPDANTLGGDWNVGGKFTLSADPVDAMAAATKGYVDAHVPAGGPFLSLAGGTMQGPIDLAADPVAAAEAANKNYVDGAVARAGIGSPRFKVAGLPASLAPVIATPLKLPFNSVVFDPSGAWDAVNSRWIPKKAGYYLVALTVNFTSAASTVFGQYQIQIRQNNANSGASIFQAILSAQALNSALSTQTLLYFNGTTDYLEGFGFFLLPTTGAWTTPSFTTGANNNFLTAFYAGP